MALDELYWDDIRPGSMFPTIRAALAQYGKRCTYVSLHDWQLDAPSLGDRISSNIRIRTTRASILALDEVTRELPNLESDSIDMPDAGWILATLEQTTTGSETGLTAFSLTVPWDFDPLVAFYQYFWLKPDQRSSNEERDGLSLLALFLAHVHAACNAGYLAMLAPMDNPVLRGVATMRFPVLDALDIRIKEEIKQ